MTTEAARPPVSRPPAGWFRIAAPILIMVGAAMAASIAYGVAKGAGASDDGALAVANFMSGAAILGLGLARWAALPAHERRPVLARKRPLVTCVLAGLGLAVVLRIAVGVIVTIGEQIDSGLCRDLASLDNDLPTVLWQKVLLAIGLVLLAPLGEELVFRGLLLRSLVRYWSFPWAAVVSGVLFAMLHLQYWVTWPLLFGISGFGVVAAYLYRRMGFAGNASMHAWFNAIAALALFVDFGQGGQDCH